MPEEAAPVSSRWTVATAGVRTAATWLATAAGASAAAVFGAGPIFKSDIDTSEWAVAQWVLVIALATLGAAAVVYVIARLLALQVPIEITLDTLPPGLRSRIETNALAEYLPGEASTIAEFKQYLQAYSNAAVRLEAAVKAELDPQEKARLEQLATIQKNNRDVFANKREELYQLAAYELEATRLTPRATKEWYRLGGAAVLSVVAMALFTLTIGSGGGDDSGEDTAAPTGGFLISSPETAGLWETLGLDQCESPSGQVPVFVLSETDTTYSVQTIGVPRDQCARYAFSVPRELVDVITVDPITVTVTAPTEK